MNNAPLVSIIVITYNSADYVLETLESAKSQTYKNIELIVTDDASEDNTVEICSKWIDSNRERFVRTQLITSVTNKGVAANSNTGLNNASGEWIKLIGGDDILMEHCINEFVDFVIARNCKFVFSLSDFIVKPDDIQLKALKKEYYLKGEYFFKLKAESQFLQLLIHDLKMNPVTFFCNRLSLLELNGFDENYSCEDIPLYIKATYKGHQLDLLCTETVIYRIHQNSQSFIGQVGLINVFWFKEYFKIRKKYISFRLFMKHPLVVIEFLVQNSAKYLITVLGNKKSYKRILQAIRMISPIYCCSMLSKKYSEHFVSNNRVLKTN